MCKIEEAKTLCFQCFSYYCDSCFKCVHEKGKNNEHKKGKIDYFVPIDIWCQVHKKDAIININIYIILLLYRTLLCLLLLFESS